MKIYIDGEYFSKENAKISVFDHGFLYGDGVFEGIRAYHGRVFKLNEHIERLYKSARAIAMDIPMTPQQMGAAVVETCKANQCMDGYIRLVVSRGAGDLGLNPYLCKKPCVVIIAGSITLYPKELYDTGMKIITAGTLRNVPEALNPKIKSLNYLNNIMAKIEAINSGVMECLLLNAQGYVAEASGDNVFIINGQTLITPHTWCGALEGITRNTVMELAAQQGFQVKEDVLTRYDLFNAEECFLTGTAAEIISVTEIDRRKIGNGLPGPKTKRLASIFHEYAQTHGTLIA